jgi:hypothetical protein
MQFDNIQMIKEAVALGSGISAAVLFSVKPGRPGSGSSRRFGPPSVYYWPKQQFAPRHEGNEPLMPGSYLEALGVERMIGLEQNRHSCRAGEPSFLAEWPGGRLAPDFANEITERVDFFGMP